MIPLVWLWVAGGAHAALFEETVFALGAIAAVVGEVLVWRTARADLQREIAEARSDAREAVAEIRAEIAALRDRLDRSLDLDRRLARLELSAAAASEDTDEG